MVACICLSPLHNQKPDFEGQSVIKASSYLLPFILEAHRESLPRSCETSARRLSAESAEVYSTADLPASAAHLPFSYYCSEVYFLSQIHFTFSSLYPKQIVSLLLINQIYTKLCANEILGYQDSISKFYNLFILHLSTIAFRPPWYTLQQSVITIFSFLHYYYQYSTYYQYRIFLVKQSQILKLH